MADAPMPRVVTLGGGHGQAALLSALTNLRCEITAIVSVADDGGCSGQLRRELGMPPPGDLRRCLTTLARDRRLAERFEVRLTDAPHASRSAGNLALSQAYVELGGLQAAVDWAADLLQCRGRVVPVAEVAGELEIYDMVAGALQGETTVDAESAAPVVAIVHGPERANPAAVAAVKAADLIFMGPGSFITSTLATLTTAEVAEAIVEASATRVMMHNLGEERGLTRGFSLEDHVRLLRDHLVIKSGELDFDFAVLRHDESGGMSRNELGDGTVELTAPLAPAGEREHDAELVARALYHHFGLAPREARSTPPPPASEARRAFEAHVARAQRRLAELRGLSPR
jgi:uncharacterized cofD-like protein